jgi:hydrogenase/urease accessory protein HupE
VRFLSAARRIAGSGCAIVAARNHGSRCHGLFHGYLNGTGMGRPADGALALLGLVFAVFVLVAIANAFVVQLGQQWTRIGVRVVGSWIAASGLLMLGWAVRGSWIHR